MGFLFHNQPALERELRAAALSHRCTDIRLSATVTSIEEDQDWVYCRYSMADGSSHCLRSKFLVGADGKTGFTRKKYLEPKGVVLERASRCESAKVLTC